jgi:lysophospholipase L1-like esterase
MEKFTHVSKETDFRFLRLAAAEASFNQYRLLLENLISHRPDLLILQVDIFYGYSQPAQYPEFLKARLALFGEKLVKRATGRKIQIEKRTELRNRVEDQLGKRGKELDQEELQKYDRYRLALQGLAQEGPASDKAIHQLMGQAAKQHIRVALLVMRRSSVAETLKDELFRPMEDALLAELQQRHGVAVLRCPIQFSPEEFHDYGHLNDAGRQRFSHWLASAARQALASGR